ncbi:MAG TPA: precorrin-8X methylmutase [Candidatus Brocadiales bacterium]|nr:precorrin-8X methylmutase [Candidatus Brocadiales bacterium]
MKTGVIALAHGSRANGGNDGLFKIVEMLQNMGKWDIVRAGFLQFAQPTFTQSVKDVVEEGAQRVVILPLLLFAGNHVRKDIPKEIEAERQKYPHVEFLYASNLGADERIAYIAADRIDEALIPLNPPLAKGEKGGFESPQAILKESFRIIDELVNLSNFDEPCRPIVRRVIHASGDPEYARSLIIHERAVEAGVSAIRTGKRIVTDVNMVKAGISKKAVERFGGSIICKIADAEIATNANSSGKTRAATAIQRSIEEMAGGIVAIGNAPTALFEIINLVNEGKANPALIIGVPVGFVGAVEAKEALRSVSIPYITNVGRKGGSAIAVAIVNALIEIAKKL